MHISNFLIFLCLFTVAGERTPKTRYADGRPSTAMRMNAQDQGIVLKHGNCPGNCDEYGARDAWVFKSGSNFYLHYDGAGPKAWLTSLATSTDLIHWTKKGAVIELGPPGSPDSASAAYGTTYWNGFKWFMFYLGTPNVTSPPDRIPNFPYMTLEAEAPKPTGPWRKLNLRPFRPEPGTFYSVTASPGSVVKDGSEYIQLFSAATVDKNHRIKRTIGLARTTNLEKSWTIALSPVLPPEEQIENTSLYYEKTSKLWYMFVNHIGIDKKGLEYTDSIWVYWSKNVQKWNAKDKAVVLDGQNCTWAKRCIGLPTVMPYGRRLAVFYDSPGGDRTTHMHRNIGLAWLSLPLRTPVSLSVGQPR